MGQGLRRRKITSTAMNAMSEELVDFHTHILPGMDDGAKDTEESKKMLEMLVKQGVHTVCLTPHFYPYKETQETFLKRREQAFSQIQPFALELGVHFALASETFFNDYLFHSEDISPLCMQGSDGRHYLLTEMPFDSHFSEHTVKRISRLIDTYSVNPVLAHIERYPKLVNNKKLIDRLIDMGCLMQINLSAFGRGFFLKKRLLGYLAKNMVHVVGTDAHNTGKRPPEYSAGISIIQKSLGEDTVCQLSRNAQQIVAGCLIQEDKQDAS
jgi:protein-tyrosine phosphatase